MQELYDYVKDNIDYGILEDIVLEKARELLQKEKEQMISFHKWMKENDTQENAEEYFHYTDEDMVNEYFNQEYRLPKEVRSWLDKDI